MKKLFVTLLLAAGMVFSFIGCNDPDIDLTSPDVIVIADESESTTDEGTDTTVSTETIQTLVSLNDIPDYSGSPSIEINGNVPYLLDEGFNLTDGYEYYAPLDELGRCGVTLALVGEDTMPTEDRGEIGSIKPSGWVQNKYPELINDLYLYNRCHLIGYQLTGENANTSNLITGTRYLNIEGMLPYEDMVADYIHETGNHVLYRVTPIFEEDNLLASGVLMEAESLEDKGLMFCVYCYNVQPGIYIDYETGENTVDDSYVAEKGTENNVVLAYVINVNTEKFHFPNCSSVEEANPNNLQNYTGTKEDLLSLGYVPCGRCNP